jgi:hypothetical protein
MALSETAAMGAAGPQSAQDTQTLITMLGNLMPLLVRIQSQVAGPSFPYAPASLTPQGATLDHQAAVSLIEDMIGDRLRSLSNYLEKHAGQYAGLDACRPLVTQAIHCYSASDYAQAFNLTWQAYRGIAALRAINPQLPLLRVADPVGSPAPPTHH